MNRVGCFIALALPAALAWTAPAQASSRRLPAVDPLSATSPGGLDTEIRALSWGEVPRLVYLNFDGGEYAPGQDDSTANVSSIARTVSRIPAWGTLDQRAQVAACMSELFSSYEVHFTTTDPGQMDHIEAVIGGTSSDLDFEPTGENPGRTGGIAPSACAPVHNGIAFSFAGNGYDVRTVCEITAHELGHVFGLEHQMTCGDVMSYGSCGEKQFLDEDSACGEYAARPCQCGTTQNSHQTLLAFLGPRGSEPLGLGFVRPMARQIVYAGFDIDVDAAPDFDRVTLEIDGRILGEDDSYPWHFTAPDLVPGEHTLIAHGERRGRTGQAVISVALQASDPSMSAVGGPCEGPSDCNTGLCVSDGQSGTCSRFCHPGGDECPTDMQCIATQSGDSVCWPDGKNDSPSLSIIEADGSGGCSASGPGAALGWPLMLLALALRRSARGARRR